MKQRLGIFQEANVVSSHRLYQSFRRGQCAQRYPEMVGIVECVEEIFVERMDILKSRETLKDGLELFRERLGRKLDLSSVEA